LGNPDIFIDYSLCNSDWSTIATLTELPADPKNQIVAFQPLIVFPTALLDRACQRMKYYILQSSDLKEERKICNLETQK
jgi:hypothetical protein